MKKAFTSVLVGVLLFIGMPAFSQNGELFLDDANVYLNGQELGDYAIRSALGDQLWMQTFSGARKQYKTGNVLMRIGIPTTAVGAGFLILGVMLSDIYEQTGDTPRSIITASFALSSIYFSAVGGVLLSIGFPLLSIGVPLKCIGAGRMDWAVKEANSRNGFAMRQPTLNVGLQQHGVGISLNF